MDHYEAAQLANRNRPSSTVEHSVEVRFGGGLDLSKIFTAGLEAGYSILCRPLPHAPPPQLFAPVVLDPHECILIPVTIWSTSDKTTAATTVICEQARYNYGIIVWPTVVKITSKVS